MSNGQLRKKGCANPSQFAMTTLAGKENVRADVVGAAASHLEALFASHAVDASHGILHARAVLAHADAALAAAARPLPAERALAVRLAALLHDADDKKYFGKASAASLANARRILGAVGAAPSEGSGRFPIGKGGGVVRVVENERAT